MSFLFSATSFPGVQSPLAAYVDGQVKPIVNPTHAVRIAISDKTTADVFDSVTTALRCMEYMRQKEQWLLQASDDILVISTGAKLIVAEASLINQKLFSSFLPVYYGGTLRFHHRSMSSVLRLADALQTVGFCVQSPLLNNFDFLNAKPKPFLLLVDINYTETPTAEVPGSKLDDGGQQQIVYKYHDMAPIKEMARFVQCLRIDSKFRSQGTGSDFQYELPIALECNNETVCFVSAVTFPFAMKTIETGINDKLYFRTSIQGVGRTITEDHILVLEEGNYDGPSFATYLQTALNSVPAPEGTDWPAWSVTFEYATGALEIQWGTEPSPDFEVPRTWEIVSEDSLMRRSFDWTGPPYDPQDPQTCSNVLRLESGATFVTDNEIFQTGTFDSTADYHCVYLHSSLSNFTSIGPQPFNRDVLTRIPVTGAQGSIIHWQPSGSGLEVAPVPQASFRTLSFRLCDSRGKPLRLHGGDISLEIYFTSSPNYSSTYN